MTPRAGLLQSFFSTLTLELELCSRTLLLLFRIDGAAARSTQPADRPIDAAMLC